MNNTETTKLVNVLFKKPVFTISNFLCLVRLLLLPIVIYFLSKDEDLLALLFVAIGVVTDIVDGTIARYFNSVSEFGKVFDPFVDKVTVIAVLGYSVYRNLNDQSTYPLILLFGTCFLFFAGLLSFIAFPIIVKKNGEVPSSNLAGKITALISVITVVFYILGHRMWADASMIFTIAMTIVSGVTYFIRDFHRTHKTIQIGWPNRITILRIFLSPLFLLIFFYDGNGYFDDNLLIFKILALVMVIALVISDRIDGVIARSTGTVSTFGKLLDPLADKISLLTIFMCFIASDWASVWMVALIYYREATISFLRTLAATEQVILAAQSSGKIKTAIQFTVVITLLSLSFLRDLADVTGLSVVAGTFFDIWDYTWNWLPYTLMSIVTFVSVLSGVDYLWGNKSIIKMALKRKNS